MRASLVFAALALPLAIYACSDDDTSSSGTSTPSTDAGSSGSTGTGDSGSATGTDAATSEDAGADAATAVRCTQADFDKTAGAGGGDFTGFPGADISFPTTLSPEQYTNHCVKVKVGSTVTFSGDFSLHPLAPSGGEVPNPIPATGTKQPNDALSLTLTATGTFGFECSRHPGSMFGAIQVVP